MDVARPLNLPAFPWLQSSLLSCFPSPDVYRTLLLANSLRGGHHSECQCSTSATPSWGVASWGWLTPWPTRESSSFCESIGSLCGGGGPWCGGLNGRPGPSLSHATYCRALLLCIALLSSYSIHLLLTCASVVGETPILGPHFHLLLCGPRT